MKFERPKGFGGSTPRNWIDNNLPRCPSVGCHLSGKLDSK
jgi:hypothetical protein